MRSPSPHQGSVALSDGRRLVYSAAGPPAGTPVLYLHGAIGSPLRRSHELEALVEALGVRYVMVNRPGFGGSDPDPERTILSFARDVRELADALGFARFALAGVSAGVPYALACAHELGPRVSAVAACSSLSPASPPHATPGTRRRFRLPLRVIAARPRTCARAGDVLAPIVRRHPELVLAIMSANASPTDRALLRERAQREEAIASFMAATAGGIRGMVEDYLLCAAPWGFSPAAVTTEVQLWHGMADVLVPVEHALQLAVSLPNCRTFLDPDEGHFFFRHRLPDILAAMSGRRATLQAARRTAVG